VLHVHSLRLLQLVLGLNQIHYLIVLLALLSGGIGIGEALLFQFIGKIVDWLGRYTPETLFAEKGWALTARAARGR